MITGKVCLTFFGQWSEVQSEICSKAVEDMYCAPGEISSSHYCSFWCDLPPYGGSTTGVRRCDCKSRTNFVVRLQKSGEYPELRRRVIGGVSEPCCSSSSQEW